jgi:hypothetical protein
MRPVELVADFDVDRSVRLGLSAMAQ